MATVAGGDLTQAELLKIDKTILHDVILEDTPEAKSKADKMLLHNAVGEEGASLHTKALRIL